MRYNARMNAIIRIAKTAPALAFAALIALAASCGTRVDGTPVTDTPPSPVALAPTATLAPADMPTPVPDATATPAPTPTAALAPTATAVPAPTPRVIRRASDNAPEAAPDFSVETFDGETLRLSDLRGQVVVLNFWASWCPPCRWEMPFFETISQEYKDRGVVFLGIAISDTIEDASDFADSAGVTYPLALDATNEIARDYETLGLPTTFLIDKDGVIQRRLGVANEGVLKIFLDGQVD